MVFDCCHGGNAAELPYGLNHSQDNKYEDTQSKHKEEDVEPFIMTIAGCGRTEVTRDLMATKLVKGKCFGKKRVPCMSVTDGLFTKAMIKSILCASIRKSIPVWLGELGDLKKQVLKDLREFCRKNKYPKAYAQAAKL